MTRAMAGTTTEATKLRSKQTGRSEFRRDGGASRTAGFWPVRSPWRPPQARPPAPGVRRTDAHRRSAAARMGWQTALVSLTLPNRSTDAASNQPHLRAVSGFLSGTRAGSDRTRARSMRGEPSGYGDS